eukprot:11979730-Alexandrium_andersonii.AAC.1
MRPLGAQRARRPKPRHWRRSALLCPLGELARALPLAKRGLRDLAVGVGEVRRDARGLRGLAAG